MAGIFLYSALLEVSAGLPALLNLLATGSAAPTLPDVRTNPPSDATTAAIGFTGSISTFGTIPYVLAYLNNRGGGTALDLKTLRPLAWAGVAYHLIAAYMTVRALPIKGQEKLKGTKRVIAVLHAGFSVAFARWLLQNPLVAA
ncbi:hypothetical protein DFJ73DRAFT_832348 [Zopfochytrium polystomum]|nr:hypothetical protein DFJ73DRAFT_832348 [Zopfochytrium polystomum]